MSSNQKAIESWRGSSQQTVDGRDWVGLELHYLTEVAVEFDASVPKDIQRLASDTLFQKIAWEPLSNPNLGLRLVHRSPISGVYSDDNREGFRPQPNQYMDLVRPHLVAQWREVLSQYQLTDQQMRAQYVTTIASGYAVTCMHDLKDVAENNLRRVPVRIKMPTGTPSQADGSCPHLHRCVSCKKPVCAKHSRPVDKKAEEKSQD